MATRTVSVQVCDRCGREGNAVPRVHHVANPSKPCTRVSLGEGIDLCPYCAESLRIWWRAGPTTR